MKILKLTFALLVTALLSSTQLFAQQSPYNNYLYCNISYAFFGSGDFSGSSIGINYTHMMSKRFGAQISYKVATGGKPEFTNRYTNDMLTNIRLVGDSGHAVSYAFYKMINIGPTFRISDNDKNQLLISAGFNYKQVKDSYVGNYNNLNGDGQITVNEFVFTSENDLGGFLQLQYLYFIKDNFSIGFHVGTQPSGNIVHDFGVTIGSRF